MLKIYGVNSKLLDKVKCFYSDSKACGRVNGKINEEFVRQRYVMLSWVINVLLMVFCAK